MPTHPMEPAMLPTDEWMCTLEGQIGALDYMLTTLIAAVREGGGDAEYQADWSERKLAELRAACATARTQYRASTRRSL